MEKKLIYKWKNNLLGTKSILYRNDAVIGSLASIDWNLDAHVSIHNDQYCFKNKGLFNPYTEIRNQRNELIGDIEYNAWTSRATISLINKKYTWSPKNRWMTSWQIENEQGEVVEIRPSSLANGGKIESFEHSELILSISLYLQKRMTIMFSMVALIPIFILLLC
ncbi:MULTISPECIES: hypothetical protein [Sphingobacterium]|uniref:hypothetical protein n=1 Tax=Sphingobacterium TaxID=28453 RepID=UPI000627A2FC|nr:hypothetical protein [Sphingobacterium sp. Ag1]KKO92542.1 hypothetical protein AAW12_04445 [Sphingobacterium sp. Ag1]